MSNNIKQQTGRSKSTATGSFIYAVIPPSKGHGKLASLAVNGGCGDFSAVECRYLADEREPQAESAFAAAGFVRAVKSAPYLRQILFFYPDSVVLHRERYAVVLFESDFDAPAVSAVFDGVREQIFEHQRYQLRLRGDYNIVFNVRSERDVLRGDKIGACFFEKNCL